ncbi:MAG: serine/threonine-protein kinase [Bacteroidales bacterium]|jgi:serine/threonine protein kinase
MSDTSQIYISESDFRNRYQYSQKDLLGEGGFAQVYKAFDKQFKEYVALKFFNKGEEGKYDVLHEMKDSRKFSHKNIIRIHDAIIVKFDHTWGHSLVQVGILEFADGGNLRDFIATTPPESKFLDVLVGILSALEYLHKDKKIIHRDLSPENILMFVEGDNWIPKIADFGISKKVDIISDANNQQKSTLLLGKVSYMAPEQFYPEKFGIHGAINTNVDLWAFGIILYELFIHKTPFCAESQDNPLKIIQSITNDPVPALDKIPDPYRTVIERCLEKDANSRVINAGELVSILKNPPSEPEAKPGTTMPITDFKQNRRRHTYIYYGIAAVLFLFITGYFVFKPGPQIYPEKIKATIISLIENKKYYLAIYSFNRLPAELKSQKTFVNLVKQANDSIQSFRVDSLMNLGNNSFNKRDYDKALNYYYKVVADYDLRDNLAQIKINRIIEVKDSIRKSKIMAASSQVSMRNEHKTIEERPSLQVAEKKTEIQYSFTINNPTGCEGIKLINIISNDKSTIISLQFSPSNNSYKIFGLNHEDAYYIEYNSKNGKSQLPIRDLVLDGGIETGKIIRLVKSAIVKLIFDRLPDTVNSFDLIQGKERMDESIVYCHFKGINIKRKP